MAIPGGQIRIIKLLKNSKILCELKPISDRCWPDYKKLNFLEFLNKNFFKELRKERAESARRSAAEDNPFRLDLSLAVASTTEGENGGAETTSHKSSPTTAASKAAESADNDGFPLECIDDKGESKNPYIS